MGPGVSPPPSTTDTPFGVCTALSVQRVYAIFVGQHRAVVLVCCVSDCTVDAEHVLLVVFVFAVFTPVIGVRRFVCLLVY